MAFISSEEWAGKKAHKMTDELVFSMAKSNTNRAQVRYRLSDKLQQQYGFSKKDRVVLLWDDDQRLGIIRHAMIPEESGYALSGKGLASTLTMTYRDGMPFTEQMVPLRLKEARNGWLMFSYPDSVIFSRRPKMEIAL